MISLDWVVRNQWKCTHKASARFEGPWRRGFEDQHHPNGSNFDGFHLNLDPNLWMALEFINFYTSRSNVFAAKEVLSGSGRPRRGNPNRPVNKVGSTIFFEGII